jgi:site-specific recombinase XerD
MAYAEAEKALATRQAYASDWPDFADWCASRGATSLPAHVGIVAAYLSSLANSGRKASTIGRRAAAIGYRHKQAGYEPPTNAEGVKAVLRGIRRTIGAARRRGQGRRRRPRI